MSLIIVITMTMKLTMILMIKCAIKVESEKFFDDMEARPSPRHVTIKTINKYYQKSPRLIKTHYPFEFLPPNLLETCKVSTF